MGAFQHPILLTVHRAVVVRSCATALWGLGVTCINSGEICQLKQSGNSRVTTCLETCMGMWGILAVDREMPESSPNLREAVCYCELCIRASSQFVLHFCSVLRWIITLLFLFLAYC